jgi:hypothetical protein
MCPDSTLNATTRKSTRAGLGDTRKKIRASIRDLSKAETCIEHDVHNWSSFGQSATAPSKVLQGVDTGLGLFATTDLYNNDVITEYAGNIQYFGQGSLHDQSHDAQIHTEPRSDVALVIRGYRRSLRLTGTNIGQMANDSRGHLNNSIRLLVPFTDIPDYVKRRRTCVNDTPYRPMRLFVVCTRYIPKGSEIYTGYGSAYWESYATTSPGLDISELS